MIHPNANDTLTVRSVFVIGPDKKVKLIITYPASTGRNFDEILRVIDSLQLTANYQVATPVNWNDGDDVIIIRRGQRRGRQGRSSRRAGTPQKPYLRVTPAAQQVALHGGLGAQTGARGSPVGSTGLPLDAHLEVQVAPGRLAGGAHVADHLALGHRLAGRHDDRRLVAVERRHAVAVVDQRHVAVAAAVEARR